MNEPLLPCPFCGADAKRDGEGVECSDWGCGATMRYPQGWNTRADGTDYMLKLIRVEIERARKLQDE